MGHVRHVLSAFSFLQLDDAEDHAEDPQEESEDAEDPQEEV
jgi:hypothetical protein